MAGDKDKQAAAAADAAVVAGASSGDERMKNWLGAEACTGQRNYGNRVTVPWVFGMTWVRPDPLRETRYFYVEWRDKPTLEPLIMKHIAPGTTIRYDELGEYSGGGLEEGVYSSRCES